MPLHPPPVQASASVTITWNLGAKPTPSPRSATVTAVHGTLVTVRLEDGSVRRYTATPAQAAALRALIGQRIAFRVDSER